MKYNIGDKIVIKEDLKFKNYDVVPSMTQYCNKTAKIINKQYNSFNKEFVYQIDLDCGIFNWYEEMFEPYEVAKIVFKTDGGSNTLKIEKGNIHLQKIRGFEVVSDEFRMHPNVNINLPKRNDKGSAGYDLRVPCEVIIPPHSHSDLIFTDICAYMNEDEVLKLFVRSSIGCKKGLILANGTGIIDSSYYPRNIGVKFYNTTDKEVRLEENERVCQCIFEKYLIIDDDVCMNENRQGGFGSSNK